ncbi:MAG: C40 family peptidase [Nocardiopsaceae bacterium]|nr:C40 family peptidase [Nocardiopsaceae bacterium]
MFKARGRTVPMVIGVSAVTTLALDVAVLAIRSAPQAPPATAAQAGSARFLASPRSAPASAVPVAPLKSRLTPHLLVAAPRPIPPSVSAKVAGMKGVRGVETVDAARGRLAGKPVTVFGVDPSTFRRYTPKPTAQSDALWRNVAAGDIAISFALGTDGGVALGRHAPLDGTAGKTGLRVGALATMGMGEVDAVVSRQTARALGMPVGNALLISAGKSDLRKLTRSVRRLVPGESRLVPLTNDIRVPVDTGGQLPDARGQVLTALQIRTAIEAAESKLGMPYVWGGESDAEGGYDCSGILQYAFGRAGVRLPRVADDQAKAGWKIPFDQARRGDLLTWAHDPTAPGYISHIALYLGDGKMLAAPRRGTVVRIQPVYFRNFQGAIRINPRLAGRLAG